MILVPIAAPVRAAIEAAMRESRRPVSAIAAQTGVAPATIRAWNRRHGWRQPTAAASSGFDPARWKAPRRAALARLYRQPWVEIGDLAVALGASRRGAEALFTRCGLEGRRPGAVAGTPEADPAPPASPGPGLLDPKSVQPRALRAAIRAHIARQILRFDAALAAEADDGPKVLDSARVLRDLGGLKRLLDDLDGDERAEAGPARGLAVTGAGHGTAFGGDSGSGGAGTDLPALRAEIARRAAALCGGRPDSGAAGEPAAAPDPDPGH